MYYIKHHFSTLRGFISHAFCAKHHKDLQAIVIMIFLMKHIHNYVCFYSELIVGIHLMLNCTGSQHFPFKQIIFLVIDNNQRLHVHVVINQVWAHPSIVYSVHVQHLKLEIYVSHVEHCLGSIQYIFFL